MILNGFRLAWGFLTAIPIHTAPYQKEQWGWAAVWFPLVGGIIGIMLTVAGEGLFYFFPAPIVAILLIILWAFVTGFLHLDGVADCCDGLLGYAPRDKRLAIMKDPLVGSFGVCGLILLLLLKTTALYSLLSQPNWGWLLICTPVLARFSALFVAWQPSARPSGMGNEFSQQLNLKTFLLASILPILLLLITGWQSVLFLMGMLVVVSAIITLAKRRIGGVTGDVMGLTIESVEVVILLFGVIQWVN